MTDPRNQRRLAAIFAADVVGYSRLMGADETGTLAALRSRWKDVLTPGVARYQGRVVKVMGDGVLVEFASAVDAVECAVAVQKGFGAANAGVAEDRQIMLRIGINLGDVIVQGGDLYGDGVNIASRLEGLAAPGGIVISAAVHDQVLGKVTTGFEAMGPQTLKNIATPVHAFRVTPLRAGGAEPVTSLKKPSIAILPFDNMSGDPEQEYFADGLTEDIITELSRFKNLQVTARNTTFQYKGKSPDLKAVGRDLGVSFLVEGSVRKFGNRVRITAQLIDAATGAHVWAERFDRELADIFSVQDEVVQMISGSVPGHIDRFALNHMGKTSHGNFTAYDCTLRGRWALSQQNEGPAVARVWFEKALAADPGFALAHAGLGMVYAYGLYVLGIPPETALSRAKENADRAVLLDDSDPRVNAYVAFTYHVSCQPLLALATSERAIAQNPNDPFANYVRACALTYGGDPQQALDWFARSERLEPYARNDVRLDTLSDCHHLLGNYDAAIAIFEGYTVIPAFLRLPAAASYARAGRQDKAKSTLEDYYRDRPAGHDPLTMIHYQIQMCARDEDKAHWRTSYGLLGFDI